MMKTINKIIIVVFIIISLLAQINLITDIINHNLTTEYNINNYKVTIDNKSVKEIEKRFLKENITEKDYILFDTSNYDIDMLYNRNGKLYIERVLSYTKDNSGNGIVLNTNDNYNYISNRDIPTATTGTIILSYMVFNTKTNYTDDIIKRYDYILTRDYEI